MVKSGQHGESTGDTVSLVLARAVYSRILAQWAWHGLAAGAEAWATPTAWVPVATPHSPSHPQLVTMLTSERTEAWSHIFRHDLQIASTVIGKMVTETGVVVKDRRINLILIPYFPLCTVKIKE